MDNESLLRIRELLVSLQETAQYAVRIGEIAANLARGQKTSVSPSPRATPRPGCSSSPLFLAGQWVPPDERAVEPRVFCQVAHEQLPA